MLDRNTYTSIPEGIRFRKSLHEELGWDKYTNNLQISVNSSAFSLKAIAEKRGMAAFLCVPGDDGAIPDYPTRRKIEKTTRQIGS